MKLPVYEFSLHFRKSKRRFPDYEDDNTPNTYTHKIVPVLANLQRVNVKNTISMVCIQPPSTGFLLIGTPFIGYKIPPPTVTRPLHLLSCDKKFVQIMVNCPNVQISLFGGAFDPEKLNVMY